ncbi:DUF763 domain-containing protein [Candidatus Pseudothioglobus singularis]|nr:DUF763 domain-containing protein [Candidatus Pseudothioglobus singularis]MDB4821630.1 DUF763 domain-containing protein [Candidatus Pseudothioglobus singularis]
MGLPLHFGKMPSWFTERMGLMGNAIVESVVDNYGKSEVLTRMSDPNWFQALGAVMGMQWNSSGVTAAVLGSLKPQINPKANDLGLYILGGKGKYGWSVPNQVRRISDKHNLNGDELAKSSQLTSRVDNNAVQDGYNLYQQYFIVTDEGEWTSITQGMNKNTRRARRYHWHSPTVKSFVETPHTGIVGEKGQPVLNLTDSKADMLRTNMVGLTKEKPSEVIGHYKDIVMPNRHDVREEDVNMTRLGSVLNMAYNSDIENFEDLVMMKGVGPRTLKSLAMVSEVVHGDASRFEDPARFSFAIGGKDGRPHPIDTKAMDETIDMLQTSVDKSKLGDKDKSRAIKRLHRACVENEKGASPISFLEDLIEYEWDHAEKNGGKTFMGDVKKGVTRTIMNTQNALLYGKSDSKSKH